MDIDYLHKLVVAVLDEGEAINDCGPKYDELEQYLEASYLDSLPGRKELADCLEACFALWLRHSGNRTWGATEAEQRNKIVSALGPVRVSRAIKASGVAPAAPPTPSGRHG